MQTSEKHRQYWHRTLLITAILLAVWAAATFGVIRFVSELNAITFLGFPLGFYMAAQGSLIIYVAILGVYTLFMNRLDRRYGVAEED